MSLPPELDFETDRAGTPERMNRAMSYILTLCRQVLALKPDYEAAIAQLQAVGLDRLNEALTPLFLNAQAISTELAAVRAQWVATNALTQLRDGILAETDADLAVVVAALSPRLAALEAAATLTTSLRAQDEAERWYRTQGY